MKLTDFTTLTFDVAGTLIDFETGILNWFRPHLESLGINKQDEDILHAFARTEAHYLQILPESSFTEILPVIYSDMMRYWNHHPIEVNGEHFQNSACDWPPFPDTVPALEELNRYFRLVAVTNSDTYYLSYMSAKMGNPFDEAVTCDQVGVNKPDHRLFHEVLRRLGTIGVNQQEILHVAQSQFHDIIPITELGWASVWINRRHNQLGFGATPEPYQIVKPSFTARNMADFVKQFQLHRQEKSSLDLGAFSLKVTFNQAETV